MKKKIVITFILVLFIAAVIRDLAVTSKIGELELVPPKRKVPAPKELSEKLRQLKSAEKRALVLKNWVRNKAAKLISESMAPGAVEDSYRSFLLTSLKLQEALKIGDEWEKLFAEASELYPQFSLKAHLTYIYLQRGKYLKAIELYQRRKAEVPESRWTILQKIWAGHAAFLLGRWEFAQTAYTRAIEQLSVRPTLLHRASQNWRLPAEYSTALYHLSLMALAQNRPARAIRYLRSLWKHWEDTVGIGGSPLWLLAGIWNLASLRQMGEELKAEGVAQKLLLYRSDPTAALVYLGALSKSPRPKPWLEILRTPKVPRNFYSDTPTIATALLSQRALKSDRCAEGFQLLTTTYRYLINRMPTQNLLALWSKNTQNTFALPLPPRFISQWMADARECEKKLQLLKVQYPYRQLEGMLKLLRAISTVRAFQWERGRELLNEAQRTLPPPLKFRAKQVAALLHFEMDRMAEAESLFSEIARKDTYYPRIKIAREYLKFIKSLKIERKILKATTKNSHKATTWPASSKGRESSGGGGWTWKRWYLELGLTGCSNHYSLQSRFKCKRALYRLRGLPPPLRRKVAMELLLSPRNGRVRWKFSLQDRLIALQLARYHRLLPDREREVRLSTPLKKLQNLYLKLDDYWYFLDRTFYDYRWGLWGIGLY